MDMQAVILAAGRGTRMGGLTQEIPKPMLNIQDKPVLAHKISFLPSVIDEVILVIGYLGEQIIKYFGDEFEGRKLRYVKQENLNGTAGALKCAQALLSGNFLVTMGDDLYYPGDLDDLIKNNYAMLSYEVYDPEKFGVIACDENGYVEKVIEKPESFKIPALANIGAYALDMEYFSYPMVSVGNGEFGLPQTIASMADHHKIKVVKAVKWLPIGNPNDLQKAEEIIETFKL